MGFSSLLILLISLLGCFNFCYAGFYFPKLNAKFTYKKTMTSNFSDLVKYEVYGMNVFEMYENGIFTHIYLMYNESYQKTYFNVWDQNSTI